MPPQPSTPPDAAPRGWSSYVPSVAAGRDAPGRGVAGTLKVLRDVASTQLGNARDILVYLPPSYEASERRYPVLYMHDGQNLFDPATSFAGEWEVDQTLENLSGEGYEAIVVGIPNTGSARADEYIPFADPKVGGGRGEQYLAFLADTLKPVIDSDFRTRPHRSATGIAGSSLGGLISLYAFIRRPDVFGLVGALSPALWPAEREILRFVRQAPRARGRVYLDVGTLEGRREVEDVHRLCRLLGEAGYTPGEDLLCVVDRGAGHNEAAWRGRLPAMLRFLLRDAGGA